MAERTERKSPILSAEPVTHTIGGLKFEQTPMGLDRVTYLVYLVSSAIGSALKHGKEVDLSTGNMAEIMAAIGSLARERPTIISELVSLLLDVHNDQEMVTHIGKHCGPSEGMRIITVAFDQNDFKQIKKDFLALQESANVAFDSES